MVPNYALTMIDGKLQLNLYLCFTITVGKNMDLRYSYPYFPVEFLINFQGSEDLNSQPVLYIIRYRFATLPLLDDRFGTFTSLYIPDLKDLNYIIYFIFNPLMPTARHSTPVFYAVMFSSSSFSSISVPLTYVMGLACHRSYSTSTT